MPEFFCWFVSTINLLKLLNDIFNYGNLSFIRLYWNNLTREINIKHYVSPISQKNRNLLVTCFCVRLTRNTTLLTSSMTNVKEKWSVLLTMSTTSALVFADISINHQNRYRQPMNYSKPLWQVERDFVKGVQNAFIPADNGQQCASMFDELDKSNPDIHEYIDRIQQATGNDRYFCMMNSYSAIIQRSVPMHLWRSNFKSDSPDYCFDANQLVQAEPESEVVRRFRR